MAPCCDMCYQKYLHADGEINGPVLRKMRLALRQKYLQRSGELATWMAMRLSEPFTDDNPPCLCDCHREGVNCLH